MHIPDGFVGPGTAAITYVASAGMVALSARKTRRELGERQVPLMGVTAAFIFAAQMMNFKVAGGTSGHLLGAALAAILLGPWAGSLVISAVLIVQALVFQDGGIMALGANAFNMAVVGIWVAWGTYRGLGSLFPGKKWLWPRAILAAWLSVVIASAAASLELAISGVSPLGIVLPAMVGVHVLIGIGEGLITGAVLAFIRATRKDLLSVYALGGGET
ncbi:MAG: energy-coupling factor ABC transporter permease [Anaerolineae bacterium]